MARGVPAGRGATPPAGSGRRATNLRDAMAPAVRRPGIRPGTKPQDDEAAGAARPARPAEDETGREPRRRQPAAVRPGQRRALLRPVPDLEAQGAALAKLPLLERPLASYYLLGSSAGLLLLLGLVMVLSASNVRSFEAFGSSYTIFVRQATWMGIGLPVLLAASRMPLRVFRRVAYPLMGVALLLLLAVLSPLGVSSNGAQRWVGVGSLTLQPSELAKLALVLWSADLLTRKHRLLGDWKHLIIPIVPMTVLVGGLIMLQPDMGTTIVVFSVLFVVLWVVGTPGRVYGGLLGVIGVIGTILAVIEPYRLERLLSYRDPFENAQGSGWQAVHGIYALSSGGWWGEGLGASREKWPDLLPASYTDFILAIIGEELGLLGCLLVVLLFGVFGYAGLRVAHRTDNQFVRLAAAGSTGWILTQAVVNMGAVVGLLPITGIPLPLVSFGGSSLVPTMLSIGMLLAFARSEPAAARLLAERAQERREARRARQGRQGRRGPGRSRPADRAATADTRGTRGNARPARAGQEGAARATEDTRAANPAGAGRRPRQGASPARSAGSATRRAPRTRAGADDAGRAGSSGRSGPSGSAGGAGSGGGGTRRGPAEPGPYRRPQRPDPTGPPAAG
ncbi:putative lipid II flippase FtsW [Pseudofrankia sp. EUN1h]|uniref:putative lipid II flippase FtsW n=1 Tax=Pseudofrankia sp. EUN1h TaxID=1834515 RepID=UPI002FF6C331